VRDLVGEGDGGGEEEARVGWAGDGFGEGDGVGLQEGDGGEACGTSSEGLKGRNGGRESERGERERSGGLKDGRSRRWVCRERLEKGRKKSGRSGCRGGYL
jgi:hypothetical protein